MIGGLFYILDNCITDYHKEDLVCDVIDSTMVDSDPCNSKYINICLKTKSYVKTKVSKAFGD